MKKKNLRIVMALVASTIAMSALAGCGTVTEEAAGAEATIAEAEVTETEKTGGEQETNEKAEESKETSDSKADDSSEGNSAADDSAAADASSGITITKVDSSTLSAKDALKGVESKLPAYEYPGAELFYYVVYDYITNELGKGYLPGDVTIPCPVIIAEDDSDKSDMLLYGAFYVYNYTLSDDTLMTVSGGSHPGLMHLKYTDEGYEVTGFDAVLDGSDYEPSAKKIFGDHYDDFKKTVADSEATEEIRAQIISNYAAANNLNINGYQDYGWEKIALPTENIDSFYSAY